MNHQPERQDVYSRVTAQMIAAIEKGTRPWVKPWSAANAGTAITRPLRANGQAYRGINVPLLWGQAADSGYTCPFWITYKQAEAMGAQVRKGEKGSLVVYANRFTKTDTNDDGQESEREIPFLKGYTVFNAQQIDGLPAAFTAQASAPPAVAPIPQAQAFIAATGARIAHGGDRAFYSPAHDSVQMPRREAFRDPATYASVLLHELTHWTSHPSRLARELGRRFGDNAYAAEELIAEMGSAFLCADLGLTPEVRDDHASYLAHWLKVLKADSRAIFTAASQAQRAADYLHQFTQPQQAAA